MSVRAASEGSAELTCLSADTGLAGDSAGAADWNAYIGPLQHGDLRAVELCKLWLVSPKASIPRELGKSCMANYHLDSEVTQSN